MFKYKGVRCPYCDKEFTESDHIVFCPDCGAPYHKECVKESGGCVLTLLHEKGEHGSRPVSKPTKKNTTAPPSNGAAAAAL